MNAHQSLIKAVADLTSVEAIVAALEAEDIRFDGGAEPGSFERCATCPIARLIGTRTGYFVAVDTEVIELRRYQRSAHVTAAIDTPQAVHEFIERMDDARRSGSVTTAVRAVLEMVEVESGK